MEQTTIRFIAGLSVFVTIVTLLSFSFGFADEIEYIFPEDSEGNPTPPDKVNFEDDNQTDTSTWWDGVTNWFGGFVDSLKTIPVIGQVVILISWIWSGILMFIFFMTGSFLPEAMPFIFKALIMTPVYVILLIAMIPLFSKVIEALGNVTLFT